jgi:hypothetical protein
VIGLITGCLWAMFFILCVTSMCLSVQGCRFVMVFILLCVGLMVIFCVVAFLPCFRFIGVYFVVPHSWCGVSRLLVEFLRVKYKEN